MASAVDKKLLQSMKFPPEFKEKVNMRKVNKDIIKRWIKVTLSKLLGEDDDVVPEMVINLLEKDNSPDIKNIQVQLMAFLPKDAAPFCKELWEHLLSAQNSQHGAPKKLLEAKKEEIQRQQKEKEQAERRREQESKRDRDIDHIRERERNDRRVARGRHGGRDDRDDRTPYARHRALPGDLDSYRPSQRGRRSRSPGHGRERASRRSPPRRGGGRDRRGRSVSSDRSRDYSPPTRSHYRRRRYRSTSRSRSRGSRSPSPRGERYRPARHRSASISSSSEEPKESPADVRKGFRGRQRDTTPVRSPQKRRPSRDRSERDAKRIRSSSPPDILDGYSNKRLDRALSSPE